MRRLRTRAESPSAPTYQRTWSDIHALLDAALEEMRRQRAKFERRHDRDGDTPKTRRALMKYVQAQTVVSTLQWTLGMIESVPLEDAQRMAELRLR